MIFGGQPEDRNVRVAGDGGVLCLANRGCRFEDGEEGSGEERDLLASDHRGRSIAEARDVLEDRVGRAKTTVLLLQQVA